MKKKVKVYECSRCGRVIEQRANKPTPKCPNCSGSLMKKIATKEY